MDRLTFASSFPQFWMILATLATGKPISATFRAKFWEIKGRCAIGFGSDKILFSGTALLRLVDEAVGLRGGKT